LNRQKRIDTREHVDGWVLNKHPWKGHEVLEGDSTMLSSIVFPFKGKQKADIGSNEDRRLLGIVKRKEGAK
jgi:hypothetical protein